MSVTKRIGKDGTIRYEATVYYYVGKKRHQVSKRGFRNKKEAKRWEVKKYEEVEKNGRPICSRKLTLKEVYDQLLTDKHNHYQYNTLYNTKKTLHYWYGDDAVINLGEMYVDKITYCDIQKFFDARDNESINVNQNIKKALNRVFKHAIRCQYTDHNPVDNVIVTGIDNRQDKHVLTKYEYQTLLTILDDMDTYTSRQLKMIVQIGSNTGLRISEILALQKSDIDLKNRCILINHKLIYKGLDKQERQIVDQLKSKASAKPAIIPESLVVELKNWMDNLETESLFLTEDGYFQNPDSLGNGLRRICRKKMGINFHFHLLRDTYATHLVQSNVPPKVAQELLRHQNFNTTYSIYVQVSNETKKKYANQVF